MVSESLDRNDCLRLRETRPVWAIYALVLALVAGFFFADLRHFLQRTDDADVFRAHEAIRGDFSFFLSPEKPMASGRIVDEFALYLVYLFCGNDPGAFHLLAAIVHAMASFALAFAFRRFGVWARIWRLVSLAVCSFCAMSRMLKRYSGSRRLNTLLPCLIFPGRCAYTPVISRAVAERYCWFFMAQCYCAY